MSTHLYSGGRLAASLPVENLSLGGAFLKTQIPFKKGTAVGLQFFCPGRAQPLAVAGKVVNAVRGPLEDVRLPTGVGVSFEPLTEEQSAALRKLLLAYATGPALLEGDGSARPVGKDPGQRLPPPPRFFEPDVAPEPAKSPPVPASPVPVAPKNEALPDATTLMVQVKGLLMQLADTQRHADALAKDNEALRSANERLQRAVAVLSGKVA